MKKTPMIFAALLLIAAPAIAETPNLILDRTKFLSRLDTETSPYMIFESYDDQRWFWSIYVDCSVYGVTDRYISADTLFRAIGPDLTPTGFMECRAPHVSRCRRKPFPWVTVLVQAPLASTAGHLTGEGP